jgi:hypothetical protein
MSLHALVRFHIPMMNMPMPKSFHRYLQSLTLEEEDELVVWFEAWKGMVLLIIKSVLKRRLI